MWRWNINLLTGWMSHIFPRLYQYEKDILSYTCPTPLSVSWLILNVSGEEWGVISWSLLPPSHSPNQLATHLLLPTPTVLDPSVSRLRRLSNISHPPRALLSQVLRGLMEVILGCSDHKSRCSWQTLEEFLECPCWDVFSTPQSGVSPAIPAHSFLKGLSLGTSTLFSSSLACAPSITFREGQSILKAANPL